MNLLDQFGVLIAILIVIYTYWKWSYKYWKRKNVPYLEPQIPHGNIESPLRKKLSFGEEITRLYQQAKEKGWKYVGIYIFMRPIFMPLDPDLIKNIMTKDFHYFVDRGLYVNENDEPINAHLVSITGNRWRNLRAKLTPTFTSRKMRMMFQTLAECGILLEKYIDDIVRNHNREPLDIKDLLGCFSTDIIGSCAFGLDCNTFKEPDSPFRKYGKKLLKQSKTELFKLTFSQNYPELARKLHITIVPKDVTEFFTEVVQRTVEYREKHHTKRKDFLQLLIDIKNNTEGDGTTLTMNEIVAQCFVFFIAGFETSSTTMTFALFELAMKPNVQDKVREEIQRVLKKCDDHITYDSLKELEYMGRVIDETLRKYPPGPFVSRQCVEDYKLPNSDVVIEKGTRVFIPIKGLHLDKEFFPNPEEFDPDRFSEEIKTHRHQYVHIPFGNGPRICIGKRFGIMQIKVGLVTILKNYKVTLNDRTKLPLEMAVDSFIPRSAGGIWLDLQKL